MIDWIWAVSSVLALQNIKLSSAKNKWVISGAPGAILTPWISLFCWALVIRPDKTSAQRIKR
jgi:hypothetical protein